MNVEKYKGERIMYRIINNKTWYFTFLWSAFTGWYDSPLFESKESLKKYIDEFETSEN